MGKTADNEKLKLKGVFYNNIALGAVIAGAVVPLLSFYRQHWTITEFVSQSSWPELYHYVLPIALAFCVAGWARQRANGALEKLQD